MSGARLALASIFGCKAAGVTTSPSMHRYVALGVLLVGCATGPGNSPAGSSGQGQGGSTGVGGGSTTAGSGGATAVQGDASPRLARLTHLQWANSVQDLLFLDAPPTQRADFTPDAIIGFDTNASQLWVSNTLRESYESAAEALATEVASNPQALAKLIPADAPSEPAARAQAFIESFGLRAYRRPLTASEVSEYQSLFQQGAQLVPELDPFAAGVALSIRLFLQSPYFLYRTELEQQSVDGRIPLSSYEVAAKLALSLTASIPDGALLQEAASGSLGRGNKQLVDAQAQRLLGTERGKASALHLHSQALALTRYDLIRKDSALYPEFTAGTPASLRKSAELFLGALYDENRGIKTLLTSAEAFVDANLAPLYGLSGSFGTEFQRMDMTAQPRRGILMHPGFLALFAGEQQPDPIHRGVFINQQLLCVELAPPTANVPPLPGEQPNTTNRQRIEALTGKGTCGQACHYTLINPLGYAFENYDSLGKYRTSDGGLTVDASGTYALDGQERSFQNALELVELMAGSQAAHRCYARHWLYYLSGRVPDAGDAATLDELALHSSAQDISTKDVVRALVQSDSFLTRAAVQ